MRLEVISNDFAAICVLSWPSKVSSMTCPSKSKPYSMFSLRFGPTDMGIPSSRRRVYTWFSKTAAVELHIDADKRRRCFEELFFRKCVTDASKYMVASDAQLASHRLEWARSRPEGWWIVQQGSKTTAAELGPFCNPSFKQRLLDYNMHLADKVKDKPVLLANLQQNASMFASVSTNAPAVMRSSWLFDIVSNKELLPAQHLLIQGFPVPGWVAPQLSSAFPFPSLLSVEDPDKDEKLLSMKEIRTLSGNSFHWSSIGSMLMYMLASSSLR